MCRIIGICPDERYTTQTLVVFSTPGTDYGEIPSSSLFISLLVIHITISLLRGEERKYDITLYVLFNYMSVVLLSLICGQSILKNYDVSVAAFPFVSLVLLSFILLLWRHVAGIFLVPFSVFFCSVPKKNVQTWEEKSNKNICGALPISYLYECQLIYRIVQIFHWMELL